MKIDWNNDTGHESQERCVYSLNASGVYQKGTPEDHVLVMKILTLNLSRVWLAGSTAHGLYNLVWGDGKNRYCALPNDCDVLIDVSNDAFGHGSIVSELTEIINLANKRMSASPILYRIEHVLVWNNFGKSSPLYGDRTTRAHVTLLVHSLPNKKHPVYLNYDIFMHNSPHEYIQNVPLAHDGILLNMNGIKYDEKFRLIPEKIPAILLSGEYAICEKNTLITTRKTNSFWRGYGKKLLSKGFTREQIDYWISSGHLDKMVWE